MLAYGYDKCVCLECWVHGNIIIRNSEHSCSISTKIAAVQCFDHKGLRQEQLCLTKTFVVEMYHCNSFVPMLHECSLAITSDDLSL